MADGPKGPGPSRDCRIEEVATVLGSMIEITGADGVVSVDDAGRIGCALLKLAAQMSRRPDPSLN